MAARGPDAATTIGRLQFDGDHATGASTVVLGGPGWPGREGSPGDLLVVPAARHALEALEDAAVLLTVARSVG